MGRLQGKVAVVTGAARGLGAAIATRFVKEGCLVIITDMDHEHGEKAAERIGAQFFFQDVTEEAGWTRLRKRIEADYGTLDILVNNAGVADRAAPENLTNAVLQNWRKVYAVNVEGVMLGCQFAIDLMSRSGGGAIVNMSSIAALNPTPFLYAYGASKAAVTQYTTSIALHCATAGHKIRCNSVHPGQIRTPMHNELIASVAAETGMSVEETTAEFLAKIPLGEFQEPIDIANAVLFLASEESRYITGTKIIVDGGNSLGG
jgi:3(or 17)beta-hydroxysteroid dehydrogenase